MVERMINMRWLGHLSVMSQQVEGPACLFGWSDGSDGSCHISRLAELYWVWEEFVKKIASYGPKDIRRSILDDLCPLKTNLPASSMYIIESGGATSAVAPTRSRRFSISDSPLATSSNTSSKPSVSNLVCLE